MNKNSDTYFKQVIDKKEPFNPSPEFLAQKKAEFLADGGEITKTTSEPWDIIEDQYSSECYEMGFLKNTKLKKHCESYRENC